MLPFKPHIIATLIITVSYLYSVKSQFLKPTPTVYYNCSSIYCQTCLNLYQCSVCSTNQQPVCCPKFCIQCVDMNNCITCQNNFILTTYNSSIICKRINITTDSNYNSSYSPPCSAGYYLDNVINSCLSCNFTNCQVCSTYQTCLMCMSQYFLHNQSNTTIIDASVVLMSIMSQCQPCISNCLNCTDGASCNQCLASYFYDSSLYQCIKCQQQYCLNCTNAQTCNQCYVGAYLNGTQCILCTSQLSNCANCTFNQSSNQVFCFNCTYGLYWNGNTCLNCPVNCQYCGIYGINVLCNLCIDTYTVSGNQTGCVPCPYGCNNCFYDNIYNNTISLICYQCLQGYALQQVANSVNLTKCVKCQFPCLQCPDFGTGCNLCQSGFYVNLKQADTLGNPLILGQCYLCRIQNCINCNSINNCTLCSDGYYLSFNSASNGYSCTQCGSSCTKCMISNSNNPSSSGNITCTACILGYVISAQHPSTCVSCNVTGGNCLFCDSTNTSSCLQCQVGYMLVQNVCKNCNISNCHACNQNNTISNQNNNSVCTQCNSTYFIVFNSNTNISQCLACQQNCLNCQNSTYCLICKLQYYLVPQSNNQNTCTQCQEGCLTCTQNGCMTCKQGFYPSPLQKYVNQVAIISCLPCVQTGCNICINGQFCKQCNQDGFSSLAGVNGNCISCPDGCINCDNEQACELCDDGYLLNEQTNTCLDVSGMPMWSIFIACSFGMALIFVGIQKISRRVLKKWRMNQKLKYDQQKSQQRSGVQFGNKKDIQLRQIDEN